MVRKPEPKAAAKAVAALLNEKGFAVSHALALEVVAAVEGHRDWNTMSALMSSVSDATAAGTFSFPAINDDTGPFDVFINGAHYCQTERFSRACDTAELMASEPEASHYALVEIYDASGKVVAAFIDPSSTTRIYSCRFDENPALVGSLAKYLKDNWDEEHVFQTGAETLMHILTCVQDAQCADASLLIGVRTYSVTESGRVLDLSPTFQPVCYVQEGFATDLPGSPFPLSSTLWS